MQTLRRGQCLLVVRRCMGMSWVNYTFPKYLAFLSKFQYSEAVLDNFSDTWATALPPYLRL